MAEIYARAASEIADQASRCPPPRAKVDRREGLTKTHHRFYDPGEHGAELARLRGLHVDLDHAVRDAYGWSDLDLGHDFHDTRQGTRYTFEPRARQEILDRLLELNHTRHAEEVRRGLHDRKPPPPPPLHRWPGLPHPGVTGRDAASLVDVLGYCHDAPIRAFGGRYG